MEEQEKNRQQDDMKDFIKDENSWYIKLRFNAATQFKIGRV